MIIEIVNISGDTVSFNKMGSLNAQPFKLLHKNICIFIWLEMWKAACYSTTTVG